ncbi:hypothetical protein FJZ53_02725 [Candidatus Woesearchaeota archaeon]|nr:hypothetical protein [Candidatus Woesearchaeota archaeon]
MMRPNITQEVRSYLSKDPSIQRDLRRGLLNMRALAKHIIRDKGLRAPIDAVISAIRRASYEKNPQHNEHNVEELFKFSNITTKNSIACLVLRNQSDIQRYLSEITKLTDFEKRETLRMIKGKNNLKVITDMHCLPKIKDIFPSSTQLETKEKLGEIRLKISLKADETKGVVARITNEMMLRDVNISEMILCVPEVILYVDEKDLLSAYQGMMSLCQGS